METTTVQQKMVSGVEFPPVVTALQNPVGQAVNYDTYLVCRVTAYPTPTIFWIFNGETLSNNEHYVYALHHCYPWNNI